MIKRKRRVPFTLDDFIVTALIVVMSLAVLGAVVVNILGVK